MSNTKLRRHRPNAIGVIGTQPPPRDPLPRRVSGPLTAWRTVSPRDGEAVRWQCVDGRWVSVTLGHGASVGTVLVLDSSGRCESVDTSEDALGLAKSWRTN